MPLTDKAIARIREMIRSGALPSGSKLPPEQELAAELGLSREPDAGSRQGARRHPGPGDPPRGRHLRDQPRTRGVLLEGLLGLRAGLAYDLLTVPHQLPAAIDTVLALPDLIFVLNHLAKPPITAGQMEPWASLIRMLADQPNVYCKLSGMVTEADRAGWTIADLRPYAEVVLEAFGPSRVMFGSDWPVCLLAADYATVRATAERLTAGLSTTERADVFGATAERAYGLVGLGS